jgi:uncharacterized protein (TIGR00251 family)
MSRNEEKSVASFTVVAKVKPKSSRRKIVIENDGGLKVFLHSPPEGGKANDELRKTLSCALRISQSSVEIVAGLKSKTKLLRISGIPQEESKKRFKDNLAST